MRPAAMTITQVSQAVRLSTMPKVKAMQNAPIVITRIVLAPSGKANAVIKRDPMKVSQNIDNSVDAPASLTPLSVINVVDQVATDASMGTWQKNARQQSQTIGSENRMPRPPA